MKKRVFSQLKKGDKLGILLYVEIFYIRISDLSDWFSVPTALINQSIYNSYRKLDLLKISGNDWIKYSHVPEVIKSYDSFPSENELDVIRINGSGEDYAKQSLLKLLKLQLEIEIKRAYKYNALFVKNTLYSIDFPFRKGRPLKHMRYLPSSKIQKLFQESINLFYTINYRKTFYLKPVHMKFLGISIITS